MKLNHGSVNKIIKHEKDMISKQNVIDVIDEQIETQGYDEFGRGYISACEFIRYKISSMPEEDCTEGMDDDEKELMKQPKWWLAKTIAECDRNAKEILKDTPWEGVFAIVESIQENKDMNEKKIDIDYIKEELDKVIKTLKPDSVFGYGSLYDIATHFYKLGINDTQK